MHWVLPWIDYLVWSTGQTFNFLIGLGAAPNPSLFFLLSQAASNLRWIQDFFSFFFSEVCIYPTFLEPPKTLSQWRFWGARDPSRWRFGIPLRTAHRAAVDASRFGGARWCCRVASRSRKTWREALHHNGVSTPGMVRDGEILSHEWWGVNCFLCWRMWVEYYCAWDFVCFHQNVCSLCLSHQRTYWYGFPESQMFYSLLCVFKRQTKIQNVFQVWKQTFEKTGAISA